MRNAVVRKKRLRAQRILDDFMRMPQRLIIPDYRDVNLKEFQRSALWAMPETKTTIMHLNDAGEGNVEL